ncbi:MAG: hypothetical protein IPM86_05205 [Saprospiraceae bacterium]|nr:hypothetical protein [Saprospiraceae bacterium]
MKKNSFNDDFEMSNFIKILFVNTIVFHDFGKINENFQASPDKMNNHHYQGKERFQAVISTHHSALGAYLYIVKHLEEVSTISKKKQGILSLIVLVFSYPIFKHHASRLRDEYCENYRFFCCSGKLYERVH